MTIMTTSEFETNERIKSSGRLSANQTTAGRRGVLIIKRLQVCCVWGMTEESEEEEEQPKYERCKRNKSAARKREFNYNPIKVVGRQEVE